MSAINRAAPEKKKAKSQMSLRIEKYQPTNLDSQLGYSDLVGLRQ